jgi:hypothetical protein
LENTRAAFNGESGDHRRASVGFDPAVINSIQTTVYQRAFSPIRNRFPEAEPSIGQQALPGQGCDVHSRD